jgi:hypothetical protein
MVEPIFEFVIIAIFIIIVIIGMFLSGRWHPPYFRKGIRIYSKTYICGSMAQVPVEEVALCEAFKRKVFPSLVFKEIGPGEFAFREKIFQFSLLSYSQIIHGY